MSARIKTIKGRYELISGGYDKSKLYITRFFGGKESGRMIQLTISNDKEAAYVQLTQKQVKELSKVLKNAFNDNKYPSE